MRRWGDGVARFPDVPPLRVPARAYLDEARYERELEVLRRSWLLAARSDEAPAPGDSVAWDGFGERVVVTRDPDGTARATGAGGPVAVAEWGGCVWVNLVAGEVESLPEYLGEVADELSTYPLESMTTVGRRDWTVPVNWKAVVDGLNESVHIPDVHPGTVSAQLLVDQTSYAILGRHSMMVVPLAATVAALQETGDHRATADCHYHVFPATVFNCMPTHVQVFTVTPLDLRLTRYRAYHLAPREALRYPAALRFQWEHTQQVADEDMAAAGDVAARRAAGEPAVFGPDQCRLSAWHARLADLVDHAP